MSYPPVGFHFRARVLGLESQRGDFRFSEVGGLSMELLTEELAEGGENRFVQKYPTRARYPDLVLKRGLLTSSEILSWVQAAIQDLQIEPRNVDVDLLNEQHEPLLTWHIVNAYPTRWSVSDLNASSNTVVIERLQMTYQRFTLTRS